MSLTFGSTLDRLTPIEQLKAEDKWFETDEAQDHARAVVFLGQATLYAVSMKHELTEDQQIYFDKFAEDGSLEALADAVKQQEFDYYETLRCMGQHKLAQYHEYINRNEIPAKHHKYICEKLENLESRKVRLILLSMPPGSAKSSYASRSFIQWYMGRHPDHKILSGGYNLRFVENEFSKPNRNVIDSPEYRQIFKDVEIDPNFRSASLWALLKYGGRYNVRSVGAGTSGIRANLIVLDDIIAGAKVATSMVELDDANRWVVGDVLPRRLPDAVILIIGTRWNSNDPIGFLQKMLETSPETMPSPFEIINISVEGGPDNPIVEEGHWLWEEFYGATHYITQRTTMEAWLWSSTYLGIPLDQQGMFFKEEDLDRFTTLPDGAPTSVTLSIDTAQKSGIANNRTAMVVFKEYSNGTSYVDDAWAGREPLLSLVDRIGKLCRAHKVTRILIEDAAMGTQIIENYALAFPAPVVPVKTQGKGTKEFNFDTFLVPKIQTGVICFPTAREWLADVVNELVSFPEGRYDDYVDAFSQYARFTTRRGRYGVKQIKLGL